jgi:hypothetical protein
VYADKQTNPRVGICASSRRARDGADVPTAWLSLPDGGIRGSRFRYKIQWGDDELPPCVWALRSQTRPAWPGGQNTGTRYLEASPGRPCRRAPVGEAGTGSRWGCDRRAEVAGRLAALPCRVTRDATREVARDKGIGPRTMPRALGRVSASRATQRIKVRSSSWRSFGSCNCDFDWGETTLDEEGSPRPALPAT